MIHKSHSKTDLIDIINYCGVPIVFNHSNNKKSLHDKFSDLFKTNTDLTLEPNHFKLSSLSDLKFYLLKPNPKKQLSIKEKQDVMRIAKSIIYYSQNGYDIHLSPHYFDTQTILDDMLYIKGFGDIPSVRRACRLMSHDPKFTGQVFNPLISPQVLKILDDKLLMKNKKPCRYTFERKVVVIHFE